MSLLLIYRRRRLVSTRERLASSGCPENYTLIHASHHLMRDYIDRPIKAGMFNLGLYAGKREQSAYHNARNDTSRGRGGDIPSRRRRDTYHRRLPRTSRGPRRGRGDRAVSFVAVALRLLHGEILYAEFAGQPVFHDRRNKSVKKAKRMNSNASNEANFSREHRSCGEFGSKERLYERK